MLRTAVRTADAGKSAARVAAIQVLLHILRQKSLEMKDRAASPLKRKGEARLGRGK
jgi:hypothetical protein